MALQKQPGLRQREILKSNGFTSRDATLTTVGTLVQRGGGADFEGSGTNIALEIVADPASPTAFEQVRAVLSAAAGRSVELIGTATASQPQQIAVRSIRVLN